MERATVSLSQLIRIGKFLSGLKQLSLNTKSTHLNKPAWEDRNRFNLALPQKHFVNSRALQRTLEFIREVCERDPWACVPGARV